MSSTAPGRPLTVHIWSDIACPWCFIGKRRFEAAVREFGSPVEVEYHSFLLAPDSPTDYEGNEVDYLASRIGVPREQVEQMLARVTEAGAGEGLRYDFDALKHTNTGLAHQALHHAKAHGLQQELVERLFQAYFEQGRHLGRVEELVELAAEVGLDADETRAVLTGGRYAAAVGQDLAAARQIGVTGVPFFLIDGRYAVSGAQSSELFVSALRQAADAGPDEDS
ncbi:DsbA family oxidoreductase [Melissospora conviva]|uniref:DsbA family oxidoreductase n=1 Tax=Melissospora conviva TaxID=3388432 RepID=UPI003B8000B4